ncbi:MAG: hypothetical protein A2508_05850 [Candidatus Lambdaproteobacteria bacterium RIFOXYD12_FULL_49_8]|uniref:Uncharacterized protein n=1 Tax=Candidatus Lambdaproteobacteria bacterium RIFOXYD2_FULL_50_16 TaxID=1817772 RepID=A0A1F6GF28_9PROT|nr:MAG: hypothetical protein A2527_04015 [Candidatus Lambdaproteobacteria bacterium RIFOXYD2_FULL_50_16]OGG98079.1 MAG: hypothetical protein A2508_05850 [Candidatus Lambdaproteobacteria bacterium RIFOXYD12_FULL_49_8]
MRSLLIIILIAGFSFSAVAGQTRFCVQCTGQEFYQCRFDTRLSLGSKPARTLCQEYFSLAKNTTCQLSSFAWLTCGYKIPIDIKANEISDQEIKTLRRAGFKGWKYTLVRAPVWLMDNSYEPTKWMIAFFSDPVNRSKEVAKDLKVKTDEAAGRAKEVAKKAKEVAQDARAKAEAVATDARGQIKNASDLAKEKTHEAVSKAKEQAQALK